MSSSRRGHAHLLCIVPMLTDDPRRKSCPSSSFCRREMSLPRESSRQERPEGRPDAPDRSEENPYKAIPTSGWSRGPVVRRSWWSSCKTGLIVVFSLRARTFDRLRTAAPHLFVQTQIVQMLICLEIHLRITSCTIHYNK